MNESVYYVVANDAKDIHTSFIVVRSLEDALEASELHERLCRLADLTSDWQIYIFNMVMPRRLKELLQRYIELTQPSELTSRIMLYNKHTSPYGIISVGRENVPYRAGEIVLLKKLVPAIIELEKVQDEHGLNFEIKPDLKSRIQTYFKRHPNYTKKLK